MKYRKQLPQRRHGFTLVEMAMVLVIVGLLVGGLVTPLSMQLEQRRVSETQKAMDDAREALIGFVLRYGYLPCPAISASNGLEDRSGNGCSNQKRVGYLPWATLGVPKLDGWNHLFRYSVTPAFADSGPASHFTLSTARDITVATRDLKGALAPATASADIPAVILSHGKNGYGSTSDQGTTIADNGSGNTDEKLNSSSATSFVSRSINDNPAQPGGEYDDLVVWLSPNILFNRMVAAQRLP